MFGRYYYAGAPPSDEPIYDAEIEELAPGPVDPEDFFTGTGLQYSRKGTSTVQISASEVVSGVLEDQICIGSLDGINYGIVIQQNTGNGLGIGNDNSPRDLNVAWTPGLGSTVTSNYATSPDGQTHASRCQIVSNGYSPYAAFSAHRNFSAWVRSTQSISPSSQQMVWVIAANDSPPTVAAGSTTWQRIDIISLNNDRYYIAVCDCRDYTGYGGTSPQSRDILVDFLQIENSSFPTEAIPVGNSKRYCDRIWHPNPINLISGGAMKMYLKFVSKFGPGDDIIAYSGDTFSGDAAKTYIWSVFVGSGDYCRLDTATWLVEINVGNGSLNGAVSSTPVSWNRGDTVEIYFVVGGNLNTTFKYCVNGGVWIDLPLTGPASNVGNLSYSADMGFLHNIVQANPNDGDAGVLPCWLQQIKFYPKPFAGF